MDLQRLHPVEGRSGADAREQRHRGLEHHLRRHRAARQHRRAADGGAQVRRGRGDVPRQLLRRPHRPRPQRRWSTTSGPATRWPRSWPCPVAELPPRRPRRRRATSSRIRPVSESDLLINGGFFVLRQEIFDYIEPGEELVLAPFARLIKERKLLGYRTTVLVHGHVQGAAAAHRPLQLGPRALGGLEAANRSAVRLDDAPAGASAAARPAVTSCSASARTATTSRSAAAAPMLRLLRELPVERITWVVLSGNGERASEARRGARRVLGRHPGARVCRRTSATASSPTPRCRSRSTSRTLKHEVRPGPRLHALPRRPAPGPPAGLRADVQHVPGPPDPRVRDHEARRRPREPERLRRARRRRPSTAR